jgi:two-component system, sporulation sensor kinase A
MEELSPNYARYMDSFFTSSLDTITIIGSDGVIQYVNPAFESLYGMSAQEVVGKSVWSLWQENVNDFPWMENRVVQGLSVAAYETRRKSTDGRWIDVSLTISPVQDLTGHAFAYLTVGRDITEKKGIEKTLRDVESMFRLIEENISDQVAIVNCEGVIEYASKSHESFLGVLVEDITGKNPAAWIHPDDLELTAAVFAKMLQEKTRCRMECRMQHVNGTWVDVEMVLTPIIQDQDVHRVVCVTRNITDRRRAEQLLLQAEKLSVVGQLGAALAHEIRNPLTSIKGFLQLLDEKITTGNEHYFDIIFSELHRIEEIIGEFLTTAKPRASDFKVCNIRGILRQTVSVMQPEAHMHNVEIQLSNWDDEWFIRGDENKLKQVFVNVLKNAIESMTRGGVILVHAEAMMDTSVRIQITDQGCGIPSNLLTHLGNPFYTTKEKGTGLGLMVCSKILHEHQGDLQFLSELGQGTTAVIQIPLHV